jgi:hypothetical protein
MIITLVSVCFAAILFFSFGRNRGTPHDYPGFSSKAIKKIMRGGLKCSTIQEMREAIANDYKTKTKATV